MFILGGIASFLLSFLAWRHLQPAGILFYQGVASAVLASLLQLAFALVRHTRWSVAFKDTAITFLLAYAFLFTVPTTVDRSYSVGMLLRLAQAPGGMSREDVSRLYVEDFVNRGGVERRLKEQQATGTRVERAGKFVLTDEGDALVTAFRVTCAIFVCQQASQ